MITETIKPIDIGKPNLHTNLIASETNNSFLTWWWLRRIGFRIDSGHLDRTPHLVLPLLRNQETALEIAPLITEGARDWFVWLRSDIAHSRCRFCFIRHVERVGELVRLINAMGGHLDVVEFDADQYKESLEREARDCVRRWEEYGGKQRYAHIAGRV